MSFILCHRRNSGRQLAVGLFLVFSIPFLDPVSANPTGPTIRHGDIQITGAGGNLQILQSTSHGIIDWNSFSIQNGEVTRFIHPGSSAATLNRVTGQALSRIDGSLLANGRVFLLNPNGVLVGRSGVVDTASFTASTLDLSDENFLSGGNLRFQANSTAGVVNLGNINAVDGDVFLIAASVLNEGSILARNGRVGLAAGNDVLIAESGSERVFVRGTGTASEDSGVINRGTVDANVAELKSFGGNIYGMAVKNEGRVVATEVTREGGQIFLRAGAGGRVRSSGTLAAKKPESGGSVVIDSGEGGETEVNGIIDAAGEGGTGGEVLILGSTINVFENSLIIADGDSGGGRILVGGGRRGQNPDFMNAANVSVVEDASFDASANVDGDGGEIIFFAGNRLSFSGGVAATGGKFGGDGGFIELSGKNEVLIPDLSSRVLLSAANGSSGTLLLDPEGIEILDGNPTKIGGGFPAGLNEIFDDDINLFLEGASLVIETRGIGVEGKKGDISVRSGVEIDWEENTNLTFHANRDFFFEGGASIQSRGPGSVEITADRSMAFGVTGVQGEGGITANTGNITIAANGAGTATGSGSAIAILSSIATADGDILITGRATETFGEGIVLGGAITASGDGNIRLVGEGSGTGGRGIWLNESTSLLSSAGAVSSITLEANSLDLAAGSIQSPGDLIIRPLASHSVINLGAAAEDVGLQLTDAELGRLSAGFQSITIGTATLDHVVVNLNEVSFSDPVAILTPNVGGEIYVNGQITGTGNASITLNGTGPSGPLGTGTTAMTYLSSDIVTEGNSILISGNVILEGNATIDSTDGGGSAVGADIKIDGTVRSPVTGVDFSAYAGTAGEIFFNEAVGSENELGLIDLKGREIVLSNQLFAGGDISIETGESITIEGGAPVSSGGNIVMKANQGAGPASGDFHGVAISSRIEADAGTIFISGRGGDSTGNTGVLLQTGGELSGWSGVTVTAESRPSSDEGVLILGSIDAGGGAVELATKGGDMRIGGAISANDEIRLIGAAFADTEFLIESPLDTSLLSVNGGGGNNRLDFSGYGSSSLLIGADQLTNIDILIGSGSDIDSFEGSASRSGFYTVTGENIATYEEGESRNIEIEGFERLAGSQFDDSFVIDVGPEGIFGGELDGRGGDDTFVFESGGIDSVYGGSGNTVGGDVIDYRSLNEDVFVDLEERVATRLSYLSDIETFIGGGGASVISGSSGDDEIVITGDGEGSIAVPGDSFPESEAGGFASPTLLAEMFFFEGFDEVSGSAGDDRFTVEIPNDQSFSGVLNGDDGSDTFIMTRGGGVATINGGSETDTLDFSSFTTPVSVNLGTTSATQVDKFSSIESVIGGTDGDTLLGTDGNDQFLVDRDNGGFLNSGSFDGFEILRGQAGTDRFVFTEQAAVSRFFGGSGTDTFVLDDSGLGGTNTYRISENSVSRNPFYLFSEIEFLQFFLGPGNDTVITDDNGLIQILNGGDGNDTLDFGTTPVSGRTPFVFGGTEVFETQFENFLLVRDATNNPDNINININIMLPGDPGNQGEESSINQFTNAGGFGEALGNAFGAIASNALIAGQASLLRVQGGQVEAPLSLDGFFTKPPQAIVSLLDESLEVDVWAELANAIDFVGATILVRNDGPYSVSLDGVPPNEIIQVLQQLLQMEPASELFEALELTIVLPITADDGAISILTVPVQIEEAVLQQLLGSLDDASYSELTEALGG